MSVSGLLYLLSEHASPERAELKRWLKDMSDRGGGFLDFDVRGLTEVDRKEFWAAATRASEALIQKYGPAYDQRENAYAAECLRSLLEMHHCQVLGEPMPPLGNSDKVFPYDGRPIDLNELWFYEPDA